MTVQKNTTYVTEKPDMKCPSCNASLVMTDRQNIEIDYCPECRGVWLDRGELDKIIERSLKPQNPEPQEDTSNRREDSGHRDGGHGSSRHGGGHSGGGHGGSRHGGGGHGGSRHGRRRGSWLEDIFH